MTRVIVGLKWARACPRPSQIPKARPRGKKAAGLRYERELARALPGSEHGPWFEFEDQAGLGWCQPDILVEFSGEIVILEAKYTWTKQGHSQIERLYKPVVELAMGQRAYGMVVCRILTREVPSGWICRDLVHALAQARVGLPTVLHWIGAGLGPLQSKSRLLPLATGLSAL